MDDNHIEYKILATSPSATVMKIGNDCIKILNNNRFINNNYIDCEVIATFALNTVKDYIIGPKKLLLINEDLRDKIVKLTNYNPISYGMLMDLAINDLMDFKPNNDNMADVIFKCVECLAMIHSVGVVHGDIKPENYLLMENDKIVLADFGYCYPFSKSEAFGTLGYRAPEIEITYTQSSFVTDVWALGAAIFVIITDDDIPNVGEFKCESPENLEVFLSAYGDFDKFKDYARSVIDNRDDRDYKDDYEICLKVETMNTSIKPLYEGKSICELLEEKLNEDNYFLIDICLKCLSPVPTDRPQNAVEVLNLFQKKIDINMKAFPSLDDIKCIVGKISGFDFAGINTISSRNHCILAELLYSALFLDGLFWKDKKETLTDLESSVYIHVCLHITENSVSPTFICRRSIVRGKSEEWLMLFNKSIVPIVNILLENNEIILKNIIEKMC